MLEIDQIKVNKIVMLIMIMLPSPAPSIIPALIHQEMLQIFALNMVQCCHLMSFKINIIIQLSDISGRVTDSL